MAKSAVLASSKNQRWATPPRLVELIAATDDKGRVTGATCGHAIVLLRPTRGPPKYGSFEVPKDISTPAG